MKNQPSLILPGLLLGAAATLAPLSAQAAYPGAKSNVTLTAVATSEVGGFKMKDSDVEKLSEKGITFAGIANPFGYDEESSTNFYLVKETTKEKNFGNSDEPDFYPTESVYEQVVKTVSQKFTNKDFIDALKDRGFAPIQDAKGYKLVAISVADTPDSYTEDLPMLFFIEKGSEIHYVGREGWYSEEDDFSNYAGPDDALMVDIWGGVEAFNYKSRTVFKTKKVSDGEGGTMVEEDYEGTTVTTESFSGTTMLGVSLFPGYWDDYEEEWFSSGSSLEFDGLAKFNGKLDGKSGQYLGTLTLSPAATHGYFDEEGYDEVDLGDDWTYYRGSQVTGGVNVSGTKAIADITPYLDALPESLSALKEAILASYEDDSEETPSEEVF